jgi:hypothetical protein
MQVVPKLRIADEVVETSLVVHTLNNLGGKHGSSPLSSNGMR